MKKLLIAGLILLMTSTVYAGTITITTLSSDSGIVYTFLNNSFNTIKNCINGNIESANIKDGTIATADMASAANPQVRDDEFFNDFTYSGMLPATDAGDLTSDISAGTSYVSGYRVVTAATAHTYTTTLDTWVYIDINGTFQYVETAIGGAQPTTPANSLLLAKVNTAGGVIAAVTDLRVTSISLGSAEDFGKKGMTLWWGNGLILSVDTGVVYNGTTRIAKTTAQTVNISTAGDYVTGISERAANILLYVYASPAGAIKLDDTAPNYHDTVGTTQGFKYYYKYGTSYYRMIGAVRLGSAQYVEQFQMKGNRVFYNDIYANTEVRVLNAGASTSFADVDCSGYVPLGASTASFNASTSAAIQISWRPKGSSATYGLLTVAEASQLVLLADLSLNPASRIGQYKVNAGNVTLYIKDYTWDDL